MASSSSRPISAEPKRMIATRLGGLLILTIGVQLMLSGIQSFFSVG